MSNTNTMHIARQWNTDPNLNGMFSARTDKQRSISVGATIKHDLNSSVRGLRELTHNLVEVAAFGLSVGPLETLLNYYAGEKAKLEACLAIARAVTFGVSIKVDDKTGRYAVTKKNDAGLNRHYATLERFVAGGAGLLNNTLHDTLKSNRPSPQKAFDAAKRADAFVKAGFEAGQSIGALRKAFDAAVKAHFADAKPRKPVMDSAPSHVQTGLNRGGVVRLFNRETGTFEEPRRKAS